MQLDRHESLFVVARKRFAAVYGSTPDGSRALTLYCGERQITFDEPELFPWAVKLAEQETFTAGSATTWSTSPLEWPRVQGLLEALLDAGVLTRDPPKHDTALLAPSKAHLDFLAQEEARSAPQAPPSWRMDAEGMLRALTGRSLERGYLETVIPVHRLSHVALDREGRQVGEVNTYPDALRLKVATEWKTCGYAGSRYRDEMPMNMTALRSMIAHWKPVLAATLLCREEFLKRYPQLPDGRWKLGELHFLTCGILALPALQLMRERDPVPTGELDPVLSSLFRVIDGVRLVSAHLLDLFDFPMTHDTLVRPSDITGGAERFDQYRSGRGVCAGPPAMIEALVDAVMNGTPVANDTPLGPWTASIPRALDYALRGIQLYAAIFSIWLRMALAYTRIREVLQRSDWQGRLGLLRNAVDRDVTLLAAGRLDLPEQRAFSDAYYRRMFNNAQAGIRGVSSIEMKNLAVELAPPPRLLGETAGAALAELFVAAEDPQARTANRDALRQIAAHVLEYVRFERNALRTVCAVQREINLLLGRPQPSQPLTGTDLAMFHTIRRGTPGKGLRYLIETLEETLGIAIENQKDATCVVCRGQRTVLHSSFNAERG